MRSVSAAKRLRVLSWLVSLYGVLTVVGGVVAGVLLYRYVRTVDSVITPDGQYVPAFTTKPYEWQGVAVAIGSVVVGTFVLVLAELMRLRAHVVVEDRGGSGSRRSPRPRVEDARPAPPSAAAQERTPLVEPVPTVVAGTVRRSRRVRGGERVRVLTSSEAERLAGSLPPSFDEGWYPDPLGQADYRRWNGQQWTGEQRTIALPQA